MTDTVRLGAAASTLGTFLEADGHTLKQRFFDWSQGPQSASAAGERGGGLGEAGEMDRKDEAKRRKRAGELHDEYVTWLREFDRMVQTGMRFMAVGMPIHPSQLRNQRTGDLDPITPADVAAAGWCASCWRNDHQMVAIEVNKRTGLRYHASLCRWCAGVRAAHKIDMPPLEMVKLHHAGRRISVQAMETAVAELRKTEPKGKKAKRRKGKAAA